MKKGRIFIVAGISGSGKGTVSDKLAEKHPNLVRPISVTMRPPRPGDRFAAHYFFVDKKIFDWLVETDQLLEYTRVWHDHYYGTLKLRVEQALASGSDLLFELNIHGIEQVTKAFPGTKTVFIKAPSEAEQRLRLELRGTVGADQDERVAGAQLELEGAEKLGLKVIVNDDLGKALEEIEAYFGL